MKHAIKLGLVCSFPPEKGTLSEYGHHLALALGRQPDVEHLLVLADETSASLDAKHLAANNIERRSVWQFDGWLTAPKIALAARRNKLDGVVFNIQFASFGKSLMPAALGLLAPLACRLIGIPVHVILHNIAEAVDLKASNYGGSAVKRWLIERATRVMTRVVLAAGTTSVTLPSYARILKQQYGARWVHHVPHGSFYSASKPCPPAQSDTVRILTFGKFGGYKIVDNLIQAFDGLQKSRPAQRFELMIAGTDNPNCPGYLADCRTRFAQVPNVAFLGYVEEAAVPALFESAGMVVFDYRATTGSSGVLNQVGAFARPAIMPDIGDLSELVRCEGYEVRFFEAENVTSLAKAIGDLTDAPELAQEMGRANFNATRKHSIEHVAQQHLTFITAQLATPSEPVSRSPYLPQPSKSAKS